MKQWEKEFDTKLEEILNAFGMYLHLVTEKKPIQIPGTLSEVEAISQLKSLFAEEVKRIIGEDDQVNSQKEVHGWNLLRAEQRKKLEEVLGK